MTASLQLSTGDVSLDIPIKAAEADETAKGADKAFKAVVKPREGETMRWSSSGAGPIHFPRS